MEDRKVQRIWCEIDASGLQGIDEKRSTRDRGCWNRETVLYIDFLSQLVCLIGKIVEEEEQKEVKLKSKEFPNVIRVTIIGLTFRKKVVHILLSQILQRL